MFNKPKVVFKRASIVLILSIVLTLFNKPEVVFKQTSISIVPPDGESEPKVFMASRIERYPVQRQMCPSRDPSISVIVGLGSWCSSLGEVDSYSCSNLLLFIHCQVLDMKKALNVFVHENMYVNILFKSLNGSEIEQFVCFY